MLLFGSLLPDVDYLFSLFLGIPLHRGFTHSFVFLIISFFVVYIILNYYKRGKETMFFSFGVLSHLFLDLFFATGVLLFWPLGTWFSIYGISNIANLPLIDASLFKSYIVRFSIDTFLGLIWLTYLYFNKKINF